MPKQLQRLMKTVGKKKKKNFSKKSLKNRCQKTKAFCRERETRGEEEREAVLGSKEKIWSTEGEESEEESPRFFLDLANTARFTFSGLRIHDPHATGPWLDPLSSSIWKILTQIFLFLQNSFILFLKERLCFYEVDWDFFLFWYI